MTKNDGSSEEIKLSEVVGSMFAVVQHGIDLAVAGSLKSLKKAAESPAKTTRFTNKAVKSVAGFTRGFIGFLAQTGDSYMQTYEDLKKDHKN
jgi:hypothetical protein